MIQKAGLIVKKICVLTLAGVWLSSPVFATSHVISQKLIDVRAYKKPITTILKDIEKQTDYKIVANQNLDKVISIKLKHYPLDKGLDRILSGLNYSVVYLDKEKTIQLKILGDKKSVTRSGLLAGEVLSEGDSENAMSGSDLAMERYKKMKISGKLPVNDPAKIAEGQMAGSDVAMQGYKKLEASGKLIDNDMSTIPEGPMAGPDLAMAHYREMEENGELPVYDSTSIPDGPMAGPDLAMVHYREMESQGELSAPSGFVVGAGEMGEADEAMARYLSAKKH